MIKMFEVKTKFRCLYKKIRLLNKNWSEKHSLESTTKQIFESDGTT
jgi:hypothetical protein